MRQALFQDIHHAESARMAWRVSIPEDHAIEDVRHPSYLWNRHREFRPGDRIEYWAIDGRFFIEQIVVAIDAKTRSIMVREIAFHDWGEKPLQRADISQAAARVEWAGPSVKWRVVVGDEVLTDKLATKEKAQEWLDQQVAAAHGGAGSGASE